MTGPELLPFPRQLRRTGRSLRLSSSVRLRGGAVGRADARGLANQWNEATHQVRFELSDHTRGLRDKVAIVLEPRASLSGCPSSAVAEAYELVIAPDGIRIAFVQRGGLRAAAATLTQILRQYGRRLPCLTVRDWPDYPRRGVLLDVSRGRVPRLETLMELASHLASFKINELQLYMEHTFAYRRYRSIWAAGGALTGAEIRRLEAHCRSLGIDLVPNQNSFGHLRHFLEHPEVKPLAEVHAPYSSDDNTFLRYPTTLAPVHPRTLPFLRDLYDELLSNFRSGFFNVGCDETWDLGRGQSASLCRRRGTGRVYLDFLLKIHREVRERGKTMMFWGDILLNHPRLIRELPRDMIALNWGYEADHPFDQETACFASANMPFYICPGTSSWQTLIGRNDNALRNLRSAARAGRCNGARGYLITDWGDGGHPQPLVVSYPAYIAGASLAWCAHTFSEAALAPVLSRHVLEDPTGRAARALLSMGIAHRLFRYHEPNATPFGATLAAPPSEQRELFCRNGLKYYARLSSRAIRSAREAVKRERQRLRRAAPRSDSGQRFRQDLDLAARMAIESCDYLCWQQALEGRRWAEARRQARRGIEHLKQLKTDFVRAWSLRNKGAAARCAPFLDWRLNDYNELRLHYSRTEACLP